MKYNKTFFALCSGIIMILLFMTYHRFTPGVKNLLVNDTAGYYSYLIQIFISHDIAGHDITALPDNYENGWFMRKTIIGHSNKYPPGLAIMMLPFFLVGHVIALITDYPVTGLSMPYKASVYFAPVVYTWLALILLFDVLSLYFKKQHLFVSLLTLFFSTNLFYYSIIGGMMTHAFLFFLFAVVMRLTQIWYKKPSIKSMVILGLSIGLSIIVRPTAGLIVVVPALYGITQMSQITDRLTTWWKYKIHLIAGVCAGLLVLSILPIYWKLSTGSWFYYSYGNETLRLTNPYILKGLFSSHNGWLVYTPVMILAVVSMLFMFKSKVKDWALPVMLFFIINIWVVLSWHCWWYMGFGMRALVESYALLSIPFAFAIYTILVQRRQIIKYIGISFILLCIAVNFVQSYQHTQMIIHYQSMTWPAYKHVS